MAYSKRVRRIIAQALARTEGNCAAAVRWLSEYSAECPAVSRDTIARLRKDPEFAALLAQEITALEKEEDGGASDPEIWGLPGVAMPESPENASLLMQKMSWACVRRIAQRLSSPDADLRALLAFQEKTQKFALALKRESEPKASSAHTASDLLECFRSIFGEELQPYVTRELLNLAHPQFGKIYQHHMRYETDRTQIARNLARSPEDEARLMEEEQEETEASAPQTPSPQPPARPSAPPEPGAATAPPVPSGATAPPAPPPATVRP